MQGVEDLYSEIKSFMAGQEENCPKVDFCDQHHLTTLLLSEYLHTVEELNDILNMLTTMKQ